MSPRNPPSALQGPATPTLSHAIASPVHAPAIPHSSNSLGLTSPPPTPSTSSISGANRLDAGSRTFVPRAAAKITVKNADGTEVSLEKLTKSTPTPSTSTVSPPQSSVLRQGSPGTPNRRPASIRMETEDQHKSRLAEQEQKDARLKAEAADKEKKLKAEAEAERQAKEAEEARQLEEATRERIRLEKVAEELKERDRKAEEERLRIEALREEEERRLKLKEEQERIEKAIQEENLRLAEKKAKEEKERKEKEEQEEQERLSREAEETRLRLEEEATAKAKAEAIVEPEPEPEEEQEREFEAQLEGNEKQGEQLEDGKDTEVPKSMQDGKDTLKDVLRINTSSIHPSTSNDKRRPGPLDLTGAMSTSSPVVAALATARVIADIATVPYPEGVNSPHPDLNQNVKNGKFRYHWLSLEYTTTKTLSSDMIVNFYYNSCRFARKDLQHFLLWMQLVSSLWITLTRCHEAGQAVVHRVQPLLLARLPSV